MNNQPMTSTEVDKIFSALCKAQGELKVAPKESNNPFFKSKYADLQTVWETLRKPLADNGLLVTQMISGSGEEAYLQTILGHTSGQWIKSICPLWTKERTPQALGSAITYSRRYSLLSITGCCQGEEDDDGHLASGPDQHVDKSSAEVKTEQKPAYNSNKSITEKQKGFYYAKTKDFPAFEPIMKKMHPNFPNISMTDFNNLLAHFDEWKKANTVAPKKDDNYLEECPF